MSSLLKQIREFEKQSIKSKTNFSGDFQEEIDEIIEQLETIVRKEVISKYQVDYTEYGNYGFKIKINDKSLHIEKLIVCNLTYNRNDEKFGYVEPRFVVTELGQKTKKHNMARYSVEDHDDIIKAIVKKLIDVIEEY